MYFPRNWKFGSALSKLRNFGGDTQTLLGTPLSVRIILKGILNKCCERIWDLFVWLRKRITGGLLYTVNLRDNENREFVSVA
jgi:hypothetical protein